MLSTITTAAKMWLIVLALVAGALTVSTIQADSAEAGLVCEITNNCGTLHHVTDNGYDAPIIGWCNYGDALDWSKEVRIAENEHSSKYCKDLDIVYVRADEEVWCYYHVGPIQTAWVKAFDKRGAYKVNDMFHGNCVVHRD